MIEFYAYIHQTKEKWNEQVKETKLLRLQLNKLSDFTYYETFLTEGTLQSISATISKWIKPLKQTLLLINVWTL